MYTEQRIVTRAATTAEHMVAESTNQPSTMEWYAAFTKPQDYHRTEERSYSQKWRPLAFCVPRIAGGGMTIGKNWIRREPSFVSRRACNNFTSDTLRWRNVDDQAGQHNAAKKSLVTCRIIMLSIF